MPAHADIIREKLIDGAAGNNDGNLRTRQPEEVGDLSATAGGGGARSSAASKLSNGALRADR